MDIEPNAFPHARAQDVASAMRMHSVLDIAYVQKQLQSLAHERCEEIKAASFTEQVLCQWLSAHWSDPVLNEVCVVLSVRVLHRP